MHNDTQSRNLVLRLAVAVVAILGAVFACVSYVVHGIAYSDVLGAPNMDKVASSEQRTAYIALIFCVLLQLVAVTAAAPIFDSSSVPLRLLSGVSIKTSRFSAVMRYLGVFAVVVIVTTIVTIGMIQVIRHLER